MRSAIRVLVFSGILLLNMTSVVASPDVAHMSDIEVSEYGVRMSEVMTEIQHHQLCSMQDTYCVRAEFDRHGISYDDKESVQKRLVLMLGKVF